MKLKSYKPSLHAKQMRYRAMDAIETMKRESRALGYPISKSGPEIDCLRRYSKMVPSDHIIFEIGTRNGGSARLMAEYSKRQVVTIDINEDPRVINLMHAYGLPVEPVTNLDGVTFICCDSKEYVHDPKLGTIGMAHIDGGHAYQDIMSDWALCSELVVDGGWILVHDMWGWPGVTEFLYELDQDPIEVADTMVVYRKEG